MPRTMVLSPLILLELIDRWVVLPIIISFLRLLCLCFVIIKPIKYQVSKNIELGLAALGGERGPAYDRIVLNAGMVDHLLGCDGAEDVPTALDRAREAIDSGKALKKLLNYIKISHKVIWLKNNFVVGFCPWAIFEWRRLMKWNSNNLRASLLCFVLCTLANMTPSICNCCTLFFLHCFF